MERFESIIVKTLAHEGGKVNDSKDSGGATAYGISSRSYPKEFTINSSGKVLSWPTVERAKEIYYNDFWIKPKIYMINDDALASKVFDIGVNTGATRSIKFLQRALVTAGIAILVDGVIGLNTLNAIEKVNDPDKLLTLFKDHARTYYESLNQPRFIKGWLKRLES